MKNFLAIDTSCNYLTVLAVKDGNPSAVFLPDCSMRHSVEFMGAVDQALKKAEISLDECDFFAAVVGAGSFTGIRIAISAIKGFASALKKPTLAVTSFDVAAYNAIESGKTLALVDALHDCYYACGYENGEVCYSPAYLTEEQVLALAEEGYTLCSCGELPIQEKAPVKKADPVAGLLAAVGALAQKQAFGDLEALYVRKSSAERE